VLAEHLGEPGSNDAAVAAIFYSGTFTVTAIFYNLLWQTAAHGNRLIAAGQEAAAAQVTRRFWPGAPSYLVATLLAFVNVPLSVGVNGAIAIFYLLPRREAATQS
jgi:hypothetical protein